MAKQKQNTEERLKGLEEGLAAVAFALTEGFKTLDKNFDNIEKRFDALDARILKVEDRIDSVEKKVDKLAKEAHVSFNNVDGKLDHLTEEVSKIDKVSGYADAYKNLLELQNKSN